MKKFLSLFALFYTLSNSLFAQSSTVIKEYILKYKDIAIQEMIRTGVPASITLAQGIHETEAGRSKLVLKSNNHFGIKCKSDWKGESVSHDDDARGECFRKYADPADSYKDHSDFLKNRPHYAPLFNLDPADFEGWAHGLKKAGYATNPKYPQILIRIINDYKLQDYTLVALGRKVDEETTGVAAVNGIKTEDEATAPPSNSTTVKRHPEDVFQINKTAVIFVPAGTSYMAIAQSHNVPLHRLFEFNDMVETEITSTEKLVFLGRKRREGATDFHTVTEGETLYDIAQTEGIQLESLLAYNYVRSDVPPRAGRTLNLKKGSPKTEEVAVAENKTLLTEQPATTAGSRYELHTVAAKQSLYAISKLYEVSIDELMQWNGLGSTQLKKGQQLRIYKK